MWYVQCSLFLPIKLYYLHFHLNSKIQLNCTMADQVLSQIFKRKKMSYRKQPYKPTKKHKINPVPPPQKSPDISQYLKDLIWNSFLDKMNTKKLQLSKSKLSNNYKKIELKKKPPILIPITKLPKMKKKNI